MPSPRDYSLTGTNAGTGFEFSDYYTTPVPRKRMKELMRRRDKPPLINFGIWIGCMAVLGSLMVGLWDSIWAVPVVILYGVFYGSGGDSRWHELGHGTVFRTRWLNEAFYQLAAFMSFRNPFLWRWSHTRHHTETVVVGRDPEIAFPRPPGIKQWILNLLYVPALLTELGKMIRLSFGCLTRDEMTFLPASEWRRTFWASRVQLSVYTLVVLTSLVFASWIPAMLIGLPTFYGSWLHHVLATTQHAGLAEDIPDHRVNSRTIYLNPFFGFIYSNMNYHVEHHMFPMVPYYALPALHEEIKGDCPPAYPSLWAAYREIIPAIVRQQSDYRYFVERKLPPGAQPTPRTERHALSLAA